MSSTGAAAGKNGIHVLIFPFPAQGHFLPLLDFTHQLAVRGVSATVLVTPKNLPALNPLISLHPTSVRALVFPFPGHPSLPAGVENVKDVGNAGNIPMITALSKLRGRMVQWFKAQSSPPAAMVSDFFLGWTNEVAREVGIPRIVFYSSGAFSTAYLYHLWANFDSFSHPVREVTFSDLPRSPSFLWEHLPSLFRRARESPGPGSEILRRSSLGNGECWGAVFNTFERLEGEYLDWWRKKMGHVFAVGPLTLVGIPDGPAREKPGVECVDEGLLGWLNGCPHGSVLYVCFGSQKCLKTAQIEAIASGLEKSGVRFVWVAKPVMAQQVEEGYGVITDEFEDRVKVKGRVVRGWAPQVAILGHPAVGGFLSHFGMNSMLEAIVAGVMIIGWPMEAEQFLNERLLVDYIGAAVQVRQGSETVPDPTALGRIISEAMREDSIEKAKAKELRVMALEAVKVGGSSFVDLDGLMTELSKLT